MLAPLGAGKSISCTLKPHGDVEVMVAWFNDVAIQENLRHLVFFKRSMKTRWSASRIQHQLRNVAKPPFRWEASLIQGWLSSTRGHNQQAEAPIICFQCHCGFQSTRGRSPRIYDHGFVQEMGKLWLLMVHQFYKYPRMWIRLGAQLFRLPLLSLKSP